MQFVKLPTSQRAHRIHSRLERATNRAVRSFDSTLARLHLGGRKANYDDARYEFVGGPADVLRRRHYDKSLRLLWKAEEHTPWLSFRDSTDIEREVLRMGLRALSDEERTAHDRIRMPEYRAFLDSEYTLREKQAVVNILSTIGHGEAYAWLVSAELLSEVKSTGARAALTMQVLEEAKHFVVLRELLQAFDVPIRRQSAWEYIFLEQVHKARGLEKFFGMNILVEGVALSLFGQMSTLPGLEVLRLFHLDEARHTALPTNYFREFPMTFWQRNNPRAALHRLRMILPALALIPQLEEDFAHLGIDGLQFGGSTLRKVLALVERSGFTLPIPKPVLVAALNGAFNGYAKLTREGHRYTQFMEMESTMGEQELAVEAEIFGESASA